MNGTIRIAKTQANLNQKGEFTLKIIYKTSNKDVSLPD